MLGREIILVAAVEGIGVRSRSAAEIVQRYSPLVLRGDILVRALVPGRLTDPLVGTRSTLPGTTSTKCRRPGAGRERSTSLVAAAWTKGHIVVEHAVVRALFTPDIVRCGRVDADRRIVEQHIVVIAGRVLGLGGVGIAGGHEAIEIGGCGIAEELGWLPRYPVDGCWLREVVVLHENVKDITNGREGEGQVPRSPALPFAAGNG